MHLDTVFTMLDRDKFTIFPGIEKDVKVFSLRKSRAKNGRVENKKLWIVCLKPFAGD